MAKKKKDNKKEAEKKESWFGNLTPETRETIYAVGCGVVALFLLFASLGKAGVSGKVVFDFFSLLFGFGYYLFLFIFIVLGGSFFLSYKHNVALPKVIGSVILFFAGIGLIELIAHGRGGMVGSLISTPLVKMFDIIVSYIILLAFIITSVAIILNSSLRFDFYSWMQKRKEARATARAAALALQADEDTTSFQREEPQKPESADDDDEPIRVENKKTIADPTAKKDSDDKAGGLVFLSNAFTSKKDFTPPPLSLLNKDSGKPGVGDIKANANIIRRTLKNFNILVEMDEISIGPSVTRYALKPAEGVKLSKIVALKDDLALALAAHPLRIEAPIPGKSLVGIEIPNSVKTTVGLGTLLDDKDFRNPKRPLTVCLGKGITGISHFASITKMPHALIAGTTGSGKSVTAHTVITSLLYQNPPEMLKFIMVDPKRVELTLYNGIPHLLTPVITDAKKAILSLKWATKEMDRRYDVLESTKVRDIQSYHENILGPAMKDSKDGDEIPERLPYIVIIIDELADLMSAFPRELEASIVRLAQMSRAVGIHLLLSTQRPSVNVITGLIKANIPTRLALQVSSQIDSRTIIDTPGAETLLGAGDMLYISSEVSQPTRIQSAFISENEVKSVVKWLSNHYKDEIPEVDISAENPDAPDPIFASMEGGVPAGGNDDEDDDPLYFDARDEVISSGKASTSYLQRKFRVGYSRAARLIDLLEEKGVIGPANGAKAREILVSNGRDGNDDSDSDSDYSDDNIDRNEA